MQKTAIENLKRDHTLPQRRFTSTSTSTSCSSDATPQILVRNTTTKENTNELEAIVSVRPEAPPATAETATAIVQSTTVQAVATAAVVSKAVTNTTTNNDGNTPLNSKSISPAGSGSGSSDPIIPATRIAATVIKSVLAAAPAVASKSVIEVYRGRPTERIVVEMNNNKSDDNDNDDDDATNWSLGWTKITNRRANQGHTNSRKDSYWITPKLKYRLRSVLELHHFVTALNSTTCNGDEELAKKTLELYKKKKKTTASKKNNKTSCNNKTERALVAASSSLVSSKPATITPLTKKKKNKANSFNNNNNSNNKVERKVHVVATSLSLVSSKPSKVTSPTEKKKKRKKSDTSNKNSSTSSKNKVERAVGVIPSSLISKPTKITSPTGISLVVTPTDRDIYQDTSGPASSALQHFYVLVETHYDKFHGGKNESEQNKVVDTIFHECATKFKYRFLTKKNEVMPQQYAKKKIVSLCTSSYRLLWKFSL